MRGGLVAAVVAVAITALAGSPRASRADPRFEASGFFGIDWFGSRSELGNSWAPEQVPGVSPLIGARLGWLALPDLPGRLQLAVEAELGFAPAFTGDSTRAGRMAYFAPVFEWRAQTVLRLARWPIVVPHLVLGAGGDTVASASPFMAGDTDPIAYWGPGLSTPIAGRWQLRFDVRHGIMPARNGGALSTVALALALGTSFGASAPRAPPAVSDADPGPPADNPDRLDACLDPPGATNRLADYGCPVAGVDAAAADDDPDAADLDNDGIADSADRCPGLAEDRDGWQDDDGCPDPDNDGDGLTDAYDACPAEAETVNDWQDDDGCPDELPAEIPAALATVVRFEPRRARVTRAAGAALQPMREMLEHLPGLRLVIIGHPERTGGDKLAHRRAEAVKWYLVDQGIAEDRITTAIGPVARSAIVFQLLR